MILKLLLPTLENSINNALKNDGEALIQISTLKNQIIKIDCTDWNLFFYMIPTENGLQFYEHHEGTTDTEISGKLSHFLQLFIKGAGTSALFEHPVDIRGNTHNITVLRDVFKNLDLDLEEKLSHFLGDQLAHKLCFYAKETKKALKDKSRALSEQIKEYLHFEAKYVISQKRVEQFYQDIARLRDDVDRLEARL